MRELCLHLLDLAQNAAAAVAGMAGARVDIRLIWDERPGKELQKAAQRSSDRQTRERQNDKRPGSTDAPRLTLCVADNGRGMTAEQVQKAQSPFYTTRVKRGTGPGRGADFERGSAPSIGLGIPLCKAAALRTGGTFSLESAPGRGTCVTAVFCSGHIDCAPLGDLPETLAVITGGHPEIGFSVSVRVIAAEDEAENLNFTADQNMLCSVIQGIPKGDARAIPRLKQYFTEKLSLFLQKGEHGMKSLEELAAIRDKMRQTVETREAAHDATRVTVGMGTSGIAAGARGVLNAFAEEVTKIGLHGVLVTQSGSIGLTGFEPVVEVVRAGAEKVTYVKMTPEKAARVVTEHLANGTPVAEYTIENAQ